MRTTQVAVYVTGCGVRLVCTDGTIVPVTRCCEAPITHAGGPGCSDCWVRVSEGYELAAIVGNKHAQRDVRQILEALSACPTPSACAAEVLAHFCPPEPLDHTHNGL